MEELSRNLDDMSPETFSLDVSEEVLDKHNWKSLFNYTEQIVKAMKLIALQDDLLKSKEGEFSLSEGEFQSCKIDLLLNNQVLDNDQEELLNANRTITLEEAKLDEIRHSLSDY